MINAQLRLENTLELYKSKLPSKPYYTNNFFLGKKIGHLKTALCASHIQSNSSTHKYFILLDLDSETSTFDWADKGLPAPHLIVRNLNDGRSHMTYILETSVKVDLLGHYKPIKYCSDIEHGLAVKVGADMNYNGLLTKNPFKSSLYKVFSFQDEPYDLDYLHEFVDKDLVKRHREAKREKGIEDGFASGRNCTLFENLRQWAYTNWHRCDLAELQSVLLSQAMEFNAFECPLSTNEVSTIADSVFRFIRRNFSIERLSELKSERAKRSRQKSKGNVIYTGEKPWETEGIPSSTYYYRKANSVKSERQTISEMKPWAKLGIGRTKWYELGKPDSI